jgi:hypothetical protein
MIKFINANSIAEKEHEWKRALGKSDRRCEDNIKRDLKETEPECAD